MSGAPHSEEAKLVASGDGWLLSAYDMTASMTTWEMHPAGDEILCVLCSQGSVAPAGRSHAGKGTEHRPM